MRELTSVFDFFIIATGRQAAGNCTP